MYPKNHVTNLEITILTFYDNKKLNTSHSTPYEHQCAFKFNEQDWVGAWIKSSTTPTNNYSTCASVEMQDSYLIRLQTYATTEYPYLNSGVWRCIKDSNSPKSF